MRSPLTLQLVNGYWTFFSGNQAFLSVKTLSTALRALKDFRVMAQLLDEGKVS